MAAKTPPARLAERTKTSGAASPGHRAYDVARGVQPRQPARAIDTGFVADPRGDPHGARAIVAPHGVKAAAPPHQAGGKQQIRHEKR